MVYDHNHPAELNVSHGMHPQESLKNPPVVKTHQFDPHLPSQPFSVEF